MPKYVSSTSAPFFSNILMSLSMGTNRCGMVGTSVSALPTLCLNTTQEWGITELDMGGLGMGPTCSDAVNVLHSGGAWLMQVEPQVQFSVGLLLLQYQGTQQPVTPPTVLHLPPHNILEKKHPLCLTFPSVASCAVRIISDLHCSRWSKKLALRLRGRRKLCVCVCADVHVCRCGWGGSGSGRWKGY